MLNNFLKISAMMLAGLTAGVYACSAQDISSKPKPENQAHINEIVRLINSDSTVMSNDPVLKKRPRYLVAPTDILQISFPVTPDFGQRVTVQPDGYIHLRLVGDLYVQGKPVPKIIELVKTAYSKILHDPEIDIALEEFEKPYFIASGELVHPGKYDLRDDLTVSEAVAVAGGFTPASKHSNVLLIRRSDGDVQVRVVNVKRMLRQADLREDSHLMPGDMVYVPQNSFSKWKDMVIPKPYFGIP